MVLLELPGRARVVVNALLRRRVPALRPRRAQVGLGRRIAGDLARLAPGRRAEAAAEQRPDGVLGLVVVAFAEVRVAHLAVAVDQVLRRPELVAPGVPGSVVVVLRDRVADLVARDRVAHVRGVLLEAELRRVNADDDETLVAVAAGPRPHGGGGAPGGGGR